MIFRSYCVVGVRLSVTGLIAYRTYCWTWHDLARSFDSFQQDLKAYSALEALQLCAI